jgi:hypothetical protein
VKTLSAQQAFGGAGRKVLEVREENAELDLDCENGATIAIVVFEPGSSVTVREMNNQIEYLG